MDLLTYNYYGNSNQLSRVTDLTPASRYGADPGDIPDIDNQPVNNYGYDEIGNLITDSAEGITNIKWSVYGKILEINKKPAGSNSVNKIVYSYDAQGNRISKALFRSNGTISYTWYVRDAQGNTLATYQSSGTNTISQLGDFPLSVIERHLYGSSRLGINSQQVDVDGGPLSMQYVQAFKQYRGYKQYELSNHLGNVLATVTDKKKGVDTNTDGFADYYDADVTTAQDYYPFGMLMPGRIGYQGESGWVSEPGEGDQEGNVVPDNIAFDNRENNAPPEYKATSSIELNPGFESGNGDVFLAYISEAEQGSGGSGSGSSSLSNGYYRYGFNGKENDNEVKGTGNQQDYGMRIYDNRLGRFLSLDPISSDYPFYTPYQFAGNKPIVAVDLDGAEEFMKTQQILLERQAKLQVATINQPKAIISTYNPNDRTFAQKWRDSKNFLAQMTYDVANGIYTLPQQLTANIRGADYIENIGGNVHEARGVFGEKQRVSNFINGATFFVPGAQGGQALKGLAFADDLMRLGIKSESTFATEGFKTIAELGLKDGAKASSSEILELAQQFLGKGYKEPVAGSGRYVSADGSRVFRMGISDITGAHGGGPHVNFETLVPNPSKPGKMKVEENIHIYLND